MNTGGSSPHRPGIPSSESSKHDFGGRSPIDVHFAGRTPIDPRGSPGILSGSNCRKCSSIGRQNPGRRAGRHVLPPAPRYTELRELKTRFWRTEPDRRTFRRTHPDRPQGESRTSIGVELSKMQSYRAPEPRPESRPAPVSYTHLTLPTKA